MYYNGEIGSFCIWKLEIAFSNPICKSWILRTMSPNRSLYSVASAITLSLLTVNALFSLRASSKGGGSVVQEQVNTGNSNFDKEINKFYSCISKTHQDPPSIQKVDSCYYQALGGSDISVGSSGSISGVTEAGNSPTTGHHHHN